MSLRCFLSLSVASALLLGCAQQPPTPPVQAPVAAAVVEPEPLPPRPFSPETLYALLTAEFAGSRGQFDVALANYAQQARETGDPQVAERAYMIARYTKSSQLALDTALLWADAAPQDQDAQAAAILALIEADQLIEALEATRAAKTRDNGALLQSIAASAKDATDTQREILLENFQALLSEDPDDPALMISTALLLQQQNQPEPALELAQRALKLQPDNTPAIILASGLLYQLERNPEALTLIEGKLKQQPNDTRLRLQYARLLTMSDLTKAQEQFQQLADANPHDPDLLLALALVAEERDDIATAETSYRALLDLGQRSDEAHLFLGKLARDQDDITGAIEHFRAVEPGPEFLPATNELLNLYLASNNTASAEQHINDLIKLLPEQDEQLTLIYSQSLARFDLHHEGVTILSAGLARHPESSGMLYARSMMYDQTGETALAEADLRALLEYDPNNPSALNALGYILADRTDRYEEARDYIERALAQQPNDPATIDSMGWVQYRLGNNDAALMYLQRAMDIYPDHEIAAHLGEVLWVTGKQDAALDVWRTGLELNPESKYIRNTLERLGVSDL